MSPEQLELARRLVAHPKWRWVEGMAVSYRRPDGTMSPRGRWPVPLMHNQENVPELTDFATAAILLRMAMEAGAGNYMVGQTAIERRWKFYGRPLVEDEDLGTVAATALLAAWGEP